MVAPACKPREAASAADCLLYLVSRRVTGMARNVVEAAAAASRRGRLVMVLRRNGAELKPRISWLPKPQ